MPQERSIRSVFLLASNTEGQVQWPIHIVYTKIIQRPGNFDFLGRVKKGICKLLTLTQSALDDLEVRDITQEVANWLVRVISVDVWVLSRGNGGKTRVTFNEPVSTSFVDGGHSLTTDQLIRLQTIHLHVHFDLSGHCWNHSMCH
jgi:hypothetical protein